MTPIDWLCILIAIPYCIRGLLNLRTWIAIKHKWKVYDGVFYQIPKE